MDTVTKLQKIIITIYLGYAYSTYRDNDLSRLKLKAKKYLDKFSDKPYEQYGGGMSLMIMKKVLSGDFKYDGVEIDDTLKKMWLSMAIGFDLTCLSSPKTKPKMLLQAIRLFAVPPINDESFSAWVAKYKEELSVYIKLIDGLDDLQEGCDIYKIIFEES